MAEEFELETIVVASPQQVSAEVDGEAVILGMERGEYYGLNPVGTRVWQLLGQPVSVRELQEGIVGEYEVSAEQALADLRALLSHLRQEGLIEIR